LNISNSKLQQRCQPGKKCRFFLSHLTLIVSFLYKIVFLQLFITVNPMAKKPFISLFAL
jgi:hypothetical protein